MNEIPEAKLDANGQVYVETAAMKAAAPHPLAAFIDLKAAGLGVSSQTYTDTFVAGPFRFRIRPVGRNVLLYDDAFILRAIEKLELEDLVSQYTDFSTFPDPDKARRNQAAQVYAVGGFRAEHPAKSKLADELIAERYETFLLGLKPTQENPDVDIEDSDNWGGLVSWSIDGMPADTYPFTPQNVRNLLLTVKSGLYERLLSLTRDGTSDAQFRRIRQ